MEYGPHLKFKPPHLKEETEMTKTWLITGSANGLGRRIAETVLDNGDRLVATARRADLLADLQEKYGDKIAVATLDVTNGAAAHAAVRVAAIRLAISTFSSTTLGLLLSRRSNRCMKTTSKRRWIRTSTASST